MTSLLSATTTERALQVLDDISAQLEQASVRRAGCNWCGGMAGISLFFAQRARAGKAPERSLQLARQGLDQALDALAEQSLHAGLFAGFTGIGWTATQLNGPGDDFEALDDALLELLSGGLYTGPFDLLEGLAGFALYALERPNELKARRIVEQALARLAESWAVTGGWPKRLVWMPASSRADHEEGELDVCVAHGAGGVLPVLAAAAQLGVAPNIARPLYETVRAWILSTTLDDPAFTFPSVVVPGKPLAPARGAWCYGDPGMAAALHAAGRAMNDEELMQFAVATAERALRRPTRSWGVSDLAICHGAAGVARCYHRLYQGSGRGLFADVTRQWLEPVLDRVPGSPWDALGVLSGAAGIGLTLLDALTGECGSWDRPLGLSTALDAGSTLRLEVAP